MAPLLVQLSVLLLVPILLQSSSPSPTLVQLSVLLQVPILLQSSPLPLWCSCQYYYRSQYYTIAVLTPPPLVQLSVLLQVPILLQSPPPLPTPPSPLSGAGVSIITGPNTPPPSLVQLSANLWLPIPPSSLQIWDIFVQRFHSHLVFFFA